MTLTTISFVACGGTNNTATTSATATPTDTTAVVNQDSFEKIDIDANCTSPDTLTDYISLKSGDQIIQDETDSNVTILHDQEDVKKVCLQSGKAHIKRSSL